MLTNESSKVLLNDGGTDDGDVGLGVGLLGEVLDSVDGDDRVGLDQEGVTETSAESSLVSGLGGDVGGVLGSDLGLTESKRSNVLYELVLVEGGVGKDVRKSLDEEWQVLTEELGSENEVVAGKSCGELATEELSFTGETEGGTVGGVLESKLLKDVGQTGGGVVSGTGVDDNGDFGGGEAVVAGQDLDTRNLLGGEGAATKGSEGRASSSRPGKHCCKRYTVKAWKLSANGVSRTDQIAAYEPYTRTLGNGQEKVLMI